MKKAASILLPALLFALAATGCGRFGNGGSPAPAANSPAVSSASAASSSGGRTVSSAAAKQTGNGPTAGIDSATEEIERMLGHIADDASQIDTDSAGSADLDQAANRLNSILNDSSDDIPGQ